MNFRHLFTCKVSAGLLLTMLSAAPAFANDQVIVFCIDIPSSSGTATRILKLAATPVVDKNYSLPGPT